MPEQLDGIDVLRRACALCTLALLIGGAPAALAGGTQLFGDGFRSLTAVVFGGGGRSVQVRVEMGTVLLGLGSAIALFRAI